MTKQAQDPEETSLEESQIDPRFVREIQYGDDPSDAIRKYRFMLKMNSKARIAILDQKVLRANVHFNRSYFYCLGDGCPYCDIKVPSPRYLSWIFVYNANDQGQALDPLGGTIKAFLFGRDKYSMLAGLKDEWQDIRQIDLIVECTDEKFQRMTIVPARPPAKWTQDATFGKQVIALRKQIVDEINPTQFIARVLNAEQIQRLIMGDAQPGSNGPQPASAPMIQMPEGAQSGQPASAEQLQNLLDSLES